MKQTIGKDSVLMEFSDILDFLEYAEGAPVDGHSHTNPKEKWCGGTWDDAVTQARLGNPKLVKSLFDGVNVLNAMIEHEQRGEIRDVTGEYFDVADFLSGEPEVFRREEFGDSRQVVPVYANFAMNYSVNVTAIKNRGCGIIALCDELSKSGFIVDLHLCQGARPGWGDGFDKKYYTDIKVALDPLDLDTAAFIVANPLCHRRLWFAMLEHATGQTSCGGYGSPDEYDTSDVFSEGLSGFYFVSSNHSLYRESNFATMESTKDHILEMIDSFKQSAEQVILG